MTTRSIKRVAYVALHTRDPETMSAFYRDAVGLTETERDGEGNVYLRCDEYHHAVVLMPTGQVGLHHYGLDVGGPDSLRREARRLSDLNVGTREAEPLPGQGPALELSDPAGNVVRLIGGMETSARPSSPRAVQPRKFGHISLLSDMPARAIRDFYVDLLEFRVSDWMLDRSLWMRCNPDHHGVGYAETGRTGMQHLCFEVASTADLTRTADHLAAAGQPLLWGPGRHGPGNNCFVYFHDPERNVIEFTAEVEQIWHDENREEPWNPETTPLWANQWGSGPSPDFLANMAPDYEQVP